MFESAHEELRSLEPVGLSRAELESGFRALSRLESRVVERRLAYTAAIDDLDDGGLDGEGLTRSAGRRSKRAARTASRTASKLKKMPRIRDALATGRITEEHAVAAAGAAERTSPEEVDEELSGSAAERPADLFAGSARRWAGAKERDGDAQARHERQRADRELRCWTDADGMRCIFGRFAPDDGAVFEKRLRAEIDRLWRLDGGRGGSPDEIRTSDQRASDALLGLVTAPMMSTKKRPHPKYQVVVKVDASRLRLDDPEGTASVADGEPLPQSVLERICCDAEFLGAIYGRDGAVLWQGRRTRLATDDQWTQLIARDGGCIGCGASPEHCEAHHVVPFAPPTRGATDIDSLALLCSNDHHLVHEHGYTLAPGVDGWELRPPEKRRSTARPRAA